MMTKARRRIQLRTGETLVQVDPLWIESTGSHVGVGRQRWGHFLVFPRHFQGDIREASACIVCWRTVQWNGSVQQSTSQRAASSTTSRMSWFLGKTPRNAPRTAYQLQHQLLADSIHYSISALAQRTGRTGSCGTDPNLTKCTSGFPSGTGNTPFVQMM